MDKVITFKSDAHKLNLGGYNKNHEREFILKKKPENKLAVEMSAIGDEFSFEEVSNRVLSSTVVEYKLAEKKPKEEIYESVEPLFSFNNKDNHSKIRLRYDENGIKEIVVEPTYVVSCTYLKA